MINIQAFLNDITDLLSTAIKTAPDWSLHIISIEWLVVKVSFLANPLANHSPLGITLSIAGVYARMGGNL